MNPDRRGRLRDAAIGVLAAAGGRGLTHRAVDAAADVPHGTTKNYFPTRDALLRAVAERCLEQYRDTAAQVAAGALPTDREGLVAMFGGLLRNVAGPGRPRLLAYLELQAEAARKPWLSAVLDPIATLRLRRIRGARSEPPACPSRRSAPPIVTLAMHGAIPHLLADGPDTLAAAGLDDPYRFVRDLLQAVYPEGDETARAGS